MPKDSGQQIVIRALVHERTSMLILAAVLMLVLSGENLFHVRAQADMAAVPQIETDNGSLYSASLARNFHSIVYQSRRRRLRRRRSRRPYFRATGGAVNNTKSGRVSVGSWGGAHVALQVKEEGATFEIDCAHGSIEGPLTLDAQGRFDSRGMYVREHGGPEREGQQPETHPARFKGWSDGKRMTLTITLTDTGQTIGDFNLTFGGEPQMTKCL